MQINNANVNCSIKQAFHIIGPSFEKIMAGCGSGLAWSGPFLFRVVHSRDFLGLGTHFCTLEELYIHCAKLIEVEPSGLVCSVLSVNGGPGPGAAAASMCQRPGCPCWTHRPHRNAE